MADSEELTPANYTNDAFFKAVSTNPELEKQAMSVAEKLIAKGHVEGLEKGRVEGLEKGLKKGLKKGRVEGLVKGRAEGLWIGRIQTLEEFLEKPQSARESLESLSLEELEERHQVLHHEYEVRFKRP